MCERVRVCVCVCVCVCVSVCLCVCWKHERKHIHNKELVINIHNSSSLRESNVLFMLFCEELKSSVLNDVHRLTWVSTDSWIFISCFLTLQCPP